MVAVGIVAVALKDAVAEGAGALGGIGPQWADVAAATAVERVGHDVRSAAVAGAASGVADALAVLLVLLRVVGHVRGALHVGL